MTIILIIIIIIILHLSFLTQTLISGNTTFVFFGWVAEYPYDRHIIIVSFWFVLLCLLSLILGYFLVRRPRRCVPFFDKTYSSLELRKIKILFNISILLLIFVSLYIIIAGHASYSEMTKIRDNCSFLFELRIIPLLCFIYIFQGVNKSSYKEFKPQIALFVALFLLFLIIQARSLFFELGCVVGYFFLKRTKNKIKLAYILVIYILSITPNLIVLGRLSPEQKDLTKSETWESIFSYEYTILCNNILSESIYQNKPPLYGETIAEGFKLVVPSFLRSVLGIIPDETKIRALAEDAQVYGGGFSIMAEMYINWKWWSLFFFFIFGALLGNNDNRWFNRKSLRMRDCCTPLIYAYFILSFRNNTAVFLKQFIQILFVASFLQIIISNRFTLFKSIGKY